MEFRIVVIPEVIEFILNDIKDYAEFHVVNHYDKTYKYIVYYDENKYSVDPSEFLIHPQKKVICRIKPVEKAVLDTNSGLDEIIIKMFDCVPSRTLGTRTLPLKIKFSPNETPVQEDSNDNSKVNKKPKIICTIQKNMFLIPFALLLLVILFPTILHIILVLSICVLAFELYISFAY